MTVISEKYKRPGVCYAVSDDGLELPVIDVTHDAFSRCPDTAELARISDLSLRALKESAKLPAFVRRFFAKRSTLMRDYTGRYVTGMSTYLQKLGAENLGKGYARGMDYRVAGSIGPVCMRLRLRETVRLLAEGLITPLGNRAGTPLHLLNIAGGTAVDSWNALIRIQKEHPGLLTGRAIHIHVLDCDAAGPSFGARAVSALCEEGALRGVAVEFHAVPYDWKDVSVLKDLIQSMERDAVVGVSSEGGLFEYGTEAEIRSNLAVLHKDTPEDCVIIGSVLKCEADSDPNLVLLKRLSAMTVNLLGLDAFRAMMTPTGWRIEKEAPDNPCYHVVSLSKQ
jgi:hypothetical protein